MGHRSALPAARSAPWTRAQAGRVCPAPAQRPRRLCPARRKAAPPARGRCLLDALHNGGPLAPRRRCRQVLGFRERTKQFVVAAQLSAGRGLQRASNGEDHSRGGGIRPHAGCRHGTHAQWLCMTRPSSASPVGRLAKGARRSLAPRAGTFQKAPALGLDGDAFLLVRRSPSAVALTS